MRWGGITTEDDSVNNWSKRTVFVTGATGLLGGHLIERLLERGARVVALVHDEHRSSYAGIQELAVDHWVRGDINELASMRRIIGDYEADAVFHLAAAAVVRTCATNPIGCLQTNIMGTANVLEAARLAGTVKAVLCMESDKSYGSVDATELPYHEDQALRPTAIYEASKAAAGHVARAYNRSYDLPTVTVRGANLYGPGDMHLSRLIPSSILKLLRGEAPTVYSGSAAHVREFVYVADAAEICVRLVEGIESSRGQAFNVGSGDHFNILKLAERLCDAVAPEIRPVLIDKPMTFAEIDKQWLDLNKMWRFVGKDFELTPWSEGIAKTVAWYRRFQREDRGFA